MDALPKVQSWIDPPRLAANNREASRAIAKPFKPYPVCEPWRRRLSALKEMRAPMESSWRQVRDYLLPFCGRWLDGKCDPDSDQFTLNMEHILDSTPIKMALTAADGLHSGLSGQATQWFSYYVGDYSKFLQSVSQEARQWTKNAQECVRDTLSISNFYLQLHPFYLENLGFGTSLMLALPNDKTRVRYYHKTIGTYWLAQNHEMEIDTAYIRVLMRAGEMARRYGLRRIPEVVREAIANGRQDRRFAIIQAIQPWNYFGTSSPHPEFEYEDVHFMENDANREDPILYRGGYRTKPFVAARWGSIGDYVYGRNCPGFSALPEIKQLQAMMRDYNRASLWTSKPAWGVVAGKLQEKSIVPGRIYEIPGGDARSAALFPLVPPVFDNSNNIAERQRLLNCISDHLYNREILLVQSRDRQITATEVIQLQAEKNSVMGPIIIRLGNEALMLLLDRTFEVITHVWHILPPPPPDIAGQEIRPYFTSELAKAQRQADVMSANQALQWLTMVYPMHGGIINSVDFDAWWRMFGDTDVLPPEVIRSKDEVARMEQQQNQMMAAQMHRQQQMEGVQAVQALGNTGVGPDSLLGAMMEEQRA